MIGDRIVVVGACGSGKSTLARSIARRDGRALLELDAVRHLPRWEPKPDDLVRAELEAFVAAETRWVIDGNCKQHRETVWRNADTIVWLDLPRGVVMRSLVGRTLRRAITREVLWNGNRERWRDVASLDPDRSIVVWGWTTFEAYRAEYTAAMADEQWVHLRWIRIRSRQEVARLGGRT